MPNGAPRLREHSSETLPLRWPHSAVQSPISAAELRFVADDGAETCSRADRRSRCLTAVESLFAVAVASGPSAAAEIVVVAAAELVAAACQIVAVVVVEAVVAAAAEGVVVVDVAAAEGVVAAAGAAVLVSLVEVVLATAEQSLSMTKHLQTQDSRQQQLPHDARDARDSLVHLVEFVASVRYHSLKLRSHLVLRK